MTVVWGDGNKCKHIFTPVLYTVKFCEGDLYLFIVLSQDFHQHPCWIVVPAITVFQCPIPLYYLCIWHDSPPVQPPFMFACPAMTAGTEVLPVCPQCSYDGHHRHYVFS